jgi:hypothetical protein
MANLPVAKEEHNAEPLIAAVADVKMSVGGYSPEVASRRSGRQAWAKWNAPLLERPCSQHPLTQPRESLEVHGL